MISYIPKKRSNFYIPRKVGLIYFVNRHSANVKKRPAHISSKKDV